MGSVALERPRTELSNTECVFCSSSLVASRSPFDEVVAEAEAGILLPALGMMVEGYFLAVTREHCLSLAHSSPQLIERMYQWVDFLTEVLSPEFGNYLVVEHGSCSGSSSGACIDHAHLHLVPIADALGPILLADSKMSWLEIKDLGSIAGPHPRGYVSLQLDGRLWISENPSIPSQWLRRRIAALLGQEVWDWAIDPGEKALHDTSLRLKRIQWPKVP
jgi:diadenosine tetraphosphate (Ap4A) HIT family hydrolase